MDFYNMLKKYYDEIFPFSTETYNFLKQFVNEWGNVLDIGSATGKYISHFRDDGYHAIGLDKFDFSVKSNDLVLGDMANLPFKENSFDFIYSIGNTLVHAKTRGEFADIILNCMKLLKPGGKFLFQILNYDRILDNNIKQLPDITTENLRFQRYYEYENESKIIFKGILRFSNSNQEYESEIPIIPIRMDEVKWVAGKSKANFVQFFGDFSGKKFFKPESFMLIAIFFKQ